MAKLATMMMKPSVLGVLRVCSKALNATGECRLALAAHRPRRSPKIPVRAPLRRSQGARLRFCESPPPLIPAAQNAWEGGPNRGRSAQKSRWKKG